MSKVYETKPTARTRDVQCTDTRFVKRDCQFFHFRFAIIPVKKKSLKNYLCLQLERNRPRRMNTNRRKHCTIRHADDIELITETVEEIY